MKGHHDLLIAEILYREAEAKINGKTTSAPATAMIIDEATGETATGLPVEQMKECGLR